MSFKLIAVTGTPGTGKTAIAKKLSLLLDYAYLSGYGLIKSAKLARGYDKKRQVPIVDPLLFTREVLKITRFEAKKGSKGLLVDSHLSHFLPKKAVNACIVLTCSLPELERRLERKGYSTAKMRENLDAEIFDTILIEAVEAGHKVIKFDTTKTSPAAINKLASRIRRI